MTHTTPEMARELAEVCAHEYVSNPDAPNALRSLADQLEALKAEQAVLVTRWKANEDVQEIIIKELTAKRDAYKLDAERHRWFAKIATSGEFDRAEKAFAHFNDVDSCTKEELDLAIDTAIAKEAK